MADIIRNYGSKIQDRWLELTGPMAFWLWNIQPRKKKTKSVGLNERYSILFTDRFPRSVQFIKHFIL